MGEDLTPTAGHDYGDTLWTPTAESAERAEITRYARWLAGHGGPPAAAVPSYQDLWQWSVREPAAFWSSIWDFFGVLGSRGDGPVLSGQMPEVTWFAGGTLNYARNALHLANAGPRWPESRPGCAASAWAWATGSPRTCPTRLKP